MASGGGDASNIPGHLIAGSSAADSAASTAGGGDAASESTSTVDMNGKPVQAHYEELAVIGTGAYGTVYKARDLTNEGTVVALKKVRVELTEDGVPASTLREIALLKQLDQFEHPNVVKLLDVCHGQRLEQEKQLVLYLVFEHVEQDLACYLERVPPPGLPLEIIKSLSKQILNGVDFLHMNRIVHRDLKPQNLLVSSKGEIKIADFGLAKTYDFEMRLTSIVVTLWYRAPEILMCQPYATPVDIWSIGCIMAEMYRRRPLFCGTSEGDQLNKIFEIIGTPSEADWPKEISFPLKSFPVHPAIPLTNLIRDLCPLGNDLLSKMLKYKGQERITAAEALKHDYFKDDEEMSSPAVGSASTS